MMTLSVLIGLWLFAVAVGRATRRPGIILYLGLMLITLIQVGLTLYTMFTTPMPIPAP
jgi:hypothetical protein